MRVTATDLSVMRGKYTIPTRAGYNQWLYIYTWDKAPLQPTSEAAGRAKRKGGRRGIGGRLRRMGVMR